MAGISVEGVSVKVFINFVIASGRLFVNSHNMGSGLPFGVAERRF